MVRGVLNERALIFPFPDFYPRFYKPQPFSSGKKKMDGCGRKYLRPKSEIGKPGSLVKGSFEQGHLLLVSSVSSFSRTRKSRWRAKKLGRCAVKLYSMSLSYVRLVHFGHSRQHVQLTIAVSIFSENEKDGKKRKSSGKKLISFSTC